MQETVQFRKMTETPVPRLIAGLAVPTIISMLITNFYNLVDAYFVGQLSTSASAAIGIVLGLQSVFQAFGFMFGHGSGSIISRKLGEKDHESASRFASSGFFSALTASLILGTIGMLFLEPVMRLLGSTDTILPYSSNYAWYILISSPALVTSCVMNNIMRYEGKAFLAMIGLVSGGVLNMALDPLFMFRFNMGISGAGLATALSQYISFLILLSFFLRKKTESRISIRKITRDPRDLLLIAQTGIPSLFRQTLNSVSTMALNLNAMPYGDAAIAAMSIVGRVMMFIASAMIGIGQGYQPVAAYNYGAGNYRRVRDGFFFTWKLGQIVLGVLGVLGLLFPGEIVGLFRNDPLVVEIGSTALCFQCISMFVQPLNVVSNMMFQSIGKSRQAAFLSCLRTGIYFVPLVILLPKVFGILGIQCAQMAADLLAFATTLPFPVKYLRQWKENLPA